MTTILVIAPGAGVRISGVKAPILRALATAVEVWEDHGIPECVVTSLLDGKHKVTSLHPKGLAADLRTHNVRDEGRDPEIVAANLRVSLGSDYDVLFEYVNEEREHIHVEYQPKKGV